MRTGIFVAFLIWGCGAKATALFNGFRFSSKPKPAVRSIWILDSPFTGELATRQAVAEAFPEAKTTLLTSIHSGETVQDWLFRNFATASLERRDLPDLIIHSFPQPGEADLLLELKRMSGGRTFLTLFTADPWSQDAARMDLVVQPRHSVSVPKPGPPHNLRTLGLPSRATPERLRNAMDEWKERLSGLPHPIVAVLIGGQSQKAVFSSEDAAKMGEKASALVKAQRGSMLVTNSRRTPEKAFRSFISQLSGFPVYVHDSKDPELEGDNPYFAYLALADVIVVTGDSASMLSDATSTGKPVYVFAPETIMEPRHIRLVVDLYQTGRVRPLGESYEPWSYVPLSVAEEVRRAIERRRDSDCERGLSWTD